MRAVSKLIRSATSSGVRMAPDVPAIAAARSMGTFAKMDWADPLDYQSLLTDEEKMVMVCRVPWGFA
jgi:hypothetical protein